MFTKLPRVLRNFYVIAATIFFLWMLILDSNNLIARYQLSSKLSSFEDEKEYYQEKIKEVEEDHNALFGDRDAIEKFAREKYLMKKETERIFVILEE